MKNAGGAAKTGGSTGVLKVEGFSIYRIAQRLQAFPRKSLKVNILQVVTHFRRGGKSG